MTARTAVLLALDRPTFGDEIASHVAARSKGRVRVLPGSLYPALHRLEQEGLVRSWIQRAGTGRPRRNYELTVRGVEEAMKVRDGLAELLGPPASRRESTSPREMAARIRECEALSLFAEALGQMR